MSKSIEINLFDSGSLNKAIEQLTELQKKFENGAEQLAREVSSDALNDAEKTINAVAGTMQGEADGVYVATEKVSNPKGSTYKVSASGRILFLEFGTGITKADSDDARKELTSGGVAQHGQFGHKQGANKDGWYDPFHHRRTMGIDAQTPMYTAKKHAKDELSRKAKEIFKI